jgi:hypothetical protein
MSLLALCQRTHAEVMLSRSAWPPYSCVRRSSSVMSGVYRPDESRPGCGADLRSSDEAAAVRPCPTSRSVGMFSVSHAPWRDNSDQTLHPAVGRSWVRQAVRRLGRARPARRRLTREPEQRQAWEQPGPRGRRQLRLAIRPLQSRRRKPADRTHRNTRELTVGHPHDPVSSFGGPDASTSPGWDVSHADHPPDDLVSCAVVAVTMVGTASCSNPPNPPQEIPDVPMAPAHSNPLLGIPGPRAPCKTVRRLSSRKAKRWKTFALPAWRFPAGFAMSR